MNMKYRRRFGLIAVILAAAAFVVLPGSALADGSNDSGDLKFALVTHAQPGDTFWDLVRKGAQAAADNVGAELVYVHGKSPEKQARVLKNMINQHVDGIALTLAFPDAMKSLVKEAQDQGIPVVALNSGFDSWKSMGIKMYIGQDEKLAGRTIGKRLNEEGAKSVLCVNQQQGAVQLASRCAGIEDTFEGDFEVLYLKGYDMSKARSRMMAKLMQNPDIDRVVTLGAPFAPVAVDAVRMAKSKADVVTFDLNPRTAGLVQDGKVLWAVDQQPYLQGYESIDLLWLNITNGDVLGGGQAILTGPSFVDSSNIDQVIKYVKRGTR